MKEPRWKFDQNQIKMGKHSAYLDEQKLYEIVEKGDVAALSDKPFSQTSEVGQIARTPFKQLEYMIVIGIAFSSRAAIRGGLDEETAYEMSDKYIQSVSVATTINQLYDISVSSFDAFTNAVHDSKSRMLTSSYIQKAKSYIDRHLNQRLSISDIAEYCGISSSHLMHLFKRYDGSTVREYLTASRLEAASHMLLYSDYKVSEIAEYFNFASSSHFSGLFKLKYGCTPLEYRNRR